MPPPPAHTRELVRSLGGTHFRPGTFCLRVIPQRGKAAWEEECHPSPVMGLLAGMCPTVSLFSRLKEPPIQDFPSWTKIVLLLLLFSTLVWGFPGGTVVGSPGSAFSPSRLSFSPSNNVHSSLTAYWPFCCSGHVAEHGYCCIRFQPCAQRLLFLGSNYKVPGKASGCPSLHQVPTLQQINAI